MSEINQKEIKTCVKQISDNCYKTSHKDNFRKRSKECKKCHSKRMTEYYATHKEKMKKQSRESNLKRYVKRPKKVEKQDDEVINPQEQIESEKEF
jgi:hypothetical protein